MPDGYSISTYFNLREELFGGWYFGRSGSRLFTPPMERTEREYLRELKNIASYLGYSREEIDAMLADSWTTDEIEEAIYG